MRRVSDPRGLRRLRSESGAAAGTVVAIVIVVWVAFFTIGLPVLIGAIQRATEKRYDFPLVTIDATVRPDGDIVLVERRTVAFHNGPFTYAYFDVAEPVETVRDFSGDGGRRGTGFGVGRPLG
jgi:hypothetical protein